MSRFHLVRCSNILKDPYNPHSKNIFYKFKNSFLNYINTKGFENYFLDFSTVLFPAQAKQIFDEIGYGLRKGVPGLYAKNLNEEVYFSLRDEKTPTTQDDYLLSLFTKTYDWKIVQARTLFLNDFMEDFTNNYAQITFKYSTDAKKDNYIVFERPLHLNDSFYYWKIFVINYEYFKK